MQPLSYILKMGLYLFERVLHYAKTFGAECTCELVIDSEQRSHQAYRKAIMFQTLIACTHRYTYSGFEMHDGG